MTSAHANHHQRPPLPAPPLQPGKKKNYTNGDATYGQNDNKGINKQTLVQPPKFTNPATSRNPLFAVAWSYGRRNDYTNYTPHVRTPLPTVGALIIRIGVLGSFLVELE